MHNGVIYTAITGGKDALRPPAHVVPGVRYVCFTDDPSLQSDVWEIRALASQNRDPTLVAKQIKILPNKFLPDSMWSLWVDGNIEIADDLEPFLRQHLAREPFQAFRHYERSCVYEEVEACIEHKKACTKVLTAQAERYRQAGMPAGLPVAQSGVLLRRHHEAAVVEALALWWREIEKGSRRDQVSLPYVVWRLQARFGFFFDGIRLDHERFTSLRQRPHEIEASYPCWRTHPPRKQLLQIFQCWRCLGERPPFRVPRPSRQRTAAVANGKAKIV